MGISVSRDYVLWIVLTSVTFLACFRNVAGANGLDFPLKDVAEVDHDRPLPDFTVVEELDEHTTALWRAAYGEQVDDLRAVKLIMRFAEFGDVQIDEKTMTWNAAAADWLDNRDETELVAGWLKGADDLLLVAFASQPGRGLYIYRSSRLLRLSDGRATAVIGHCGTAGTRRAYLSFSPLEFYHYAYDAQRGELQVRLRRYRELSRLRPALLHHPTLDEGGEKFWFAALREIVDFRYAYEDGALRSVSTEFFYETQEDDTAQDIAQFYLGPHATERDIRRSNPELFNRGNLGSVSKRLPKGIRVRIPTRHERVYAAYASSDILLSDPYHHVLSTRSYGASVERLLIDLNDDGMDEVLAACTSDRGTGGNEFQIYRREGRGYRYMGTVSAQRLRLGQPGPSGFADLLVWSRLGGGETGTHGTFTRYQSQNKRYFRKESSDSPAKVGIPETVLRMPGPDQAAPLPDDSWLLLGTEYCPDYRSGNREWKPR